MNWMCQFSVLVFSAEISSVRSIIISKLISGTQTQSSPRYLIRAGSREHPIHHEATQTACQHWGTQICHIRWILFLIQSLDPKNMFRVVIERPSPKSKCKDCSFPPPTYRGCKWELMARCPSLVWIFVSSAGLLCSIITIITTNIFSSCIRAQLPASPNRYPPENCTKIYSRAICLYWVSAGDWCFCCSVQDHSERPPYPGQDNRQSGFVKTVTSLLTDWAMSSCDDIIYDGQCLNTLQTSDSYCD